MTDGGRVFGKYSTGLKPAGYDRGIKGHFSFENGGDGGYEGI